MNFITQISSFHANIIYISFAFRFRRTRFPRAWPQPPRQQPLPPVGSSPQSAGLAALRLVFTY